VNNDAGAPRVFLYFDLLKRKTENPRHETTEELLLVALSAYLPQRWQYLPTHKMAMLHDFCE